MKLKSAFNKFLNDSALFYSDLMTKLEALFGSTFKAGTASSGTANTKDRRCAFLRCIQKCLLYLGDIARYTEVYSETKEKEYKIAEKYYERAAFLIPTNGNAHNQLAVLATYQEAECVAIYYYCRSVLVTDPFPVGLDNLTVLFDKNCRIYEQLKAMNIIGNNSNNTDDYSDKTKSAHIACTNNDATNNTEKNKKSITKKTKTFLVQFIHLHSVLFDYNKALQSMSAVDDAGLCGAGDDGEPVAKSAPQLDHDEFLQSVDTVFADYDLLVEWSSFGDLILLRFLIICIFSVHQSPLVSSRHPIADRSGKGYSRSISESLSLTVTYKMIGVIAARVVKIMHGISADPSDRHRKIAATNRLLPILSVFCEWFHQRDEYIRDSHHTAELAAVAMRGGDCGGVVSCGRLLEVEERCKGDMISSLLELKPLIEEQMSNKGVHASSAAVKDSRPLREHIELRGFLPLADYYETFFAGESSNPLGRLGAPVAEELSRTRRLRTVRSFLKSKFPLRYESHIAAASSEPAAQDTISSHVNSSSSSSVPVGHVTVVDFQVDAQKASMGAAVKGLLPLKITLAGAAESKNSKGRGEQTGAKLFAKVARKRSEKIFKIGSKISGSTNYATSKMFAGGPAPATQPSFDGNDEMEIDENVFMDGDDNDDEEDEGADSGDVERVERAPLEDSQQPSAHPSSMSMEDDDEDPGDVVVFRPAFSRAPAGRAARTAPAWGAGFGGALTGGMGELGLGAPGSFGSLSNGSEQQGGSRLTRWLDNNPTGISDSGSSGALFAMGTLATSDQLEAFLSSSTDPYTSKMSDYNWMLHGDKESNTAAALLPAGMAPTAVYGTVPPPPGFF